MHAQKSLRYKTSSRKGNLNFSIALEGGAPKIAELVYGRSNYLDDLDGSWD